MNKVSNIINNYYFCCLKPSKIHGVGVFALRDILKNTNPFNNINETISDYFKIDDLNVDKNIIQNFRQKVWARKGEVFINIDMCSNKIFKDYINHNENNPNLKYYYDENIHEWIFLSKIDIKEGEELTYNYKTIGNINF
tara:strand:+ start:218 stop:634 length:417 start_codon:yes stop_codon:yes gene_type:complete